MNKRGRPQSVEEENCPSPSVKSPPVKKLNDLKSPTNKPKMPPKLKVIRRGAEDSGNGACALELIQESQLMIGAGN